MKRMIFPSLFLIFEPLLKFAAELGARDERAHVERKDGFVFQPLGNIAAHDALGESFCDRGLADTRFTDENGVVFGFS